MEHWIGLLDCNNFFVSCERLFRPDLIGRPVLVLSSNDGCVVARSKEVKDIGIPMGVPYFHIKDIIKTNDITIFSGNHKLYRDISKRVFVAMAEVVEDVQQYSVDEAFFEFKASQEQALILADKVKDTVEQMTGMPVSLGIASSKTLAKVANDIAKKTGESKVLDIPEWEDLQRTYRLHDVWGIGKQLSQRLTGVQIQTVEHLLKTDRAIIRQLFGVVGERLQQELSGVYVPSKQRQSKQSIMSSRSFKQASYKRSVLEEEVAFHVEQIAFDLRRIRSKTKSVSVFIGTSRYGDFSLQGGVLEGQLSEATNSTSTLVVEATRLLRELYQDGVPYTRTGIRVTNLIPQDIQQLDLFSLDSKATNDTLQAALDSINSKHKQGRVHVGFLRSQQQSTTRADSRSPNYTTAWEELAKVKA